MGTLTEVPGLPLAPPVIFSEPPDAEVTAVLGAAALKENVAVRTVAPRVAVPVVPEKVTLKLTGVTVPTGTNADCPPGEKNTDPAKLAVGVTETVPLNPVA